MMEIVSQILTERPGRSRKREYSISDLDSAVSSQSDERKHVLLYPGDYASEWTSTVEIEVPENVSITLLPGAIVEYDGNFRRKSYRNYSGPAQEAKDSQGDLVHPLSDGERYVSPNFTGHVENITDLNLASEWAFKQEFERSLWSLRNADSATAINIPHEGVLELRPENKIEITSGAVPGVEEGAYVEIDHKEVTTQVIGPGTTTTGGNINNEGTPHVIQNLSVDDGHVVAGDTLEVVTRLEGTSKFINVSQMEGDIEIDHGTVGTEIDPTQVANLDQKSVSSIETDERGHVENVVFEDRTREVQAGIALSGNGLGSGKFEVNHKPISISGSPENSGATLVRSVEPFTPASGVETGHVSGVEAVDVVEGNNIIIDASGTTEIEISTVPTVKTRSPNQNEGENGDMWFVEE